AAVGMGPIPLYLVFAVMSLGSGAAYNCVLPSVQMWFPDRRGFAMGCVVGCAGAAGLVFSPYAEYWLSRAGAKGAFLAVGAAYIVILLVASVGFDRPPDGFLPAGYTPPPAKEGGGDLTTREMLRCRSFWPLSLGMLASVLAYLMLSPQVKSLVVERGLSVRAATLTVMFCGLANACGRLVGSWTSDKFGLRPVILASQGATLCAMVLLYLANGWLVPLLCFATAFCYGGYLATYPTLTSALFGLKYAGGNYGCVLLSTVVSALFAPVAVSVLSGLGGARTPFLAGAASSLVAAALISSLREKKGKTDLKAA
ncbi:MAG TPA: MFS transporter, partial [Candidatus Acidoferrum sp.]|nr:MFS transporter [Candidatus Acidoferrum sp.]